MQVDTTPNLNVDSSFPLRGEPALNDSSVRPLLSRILTHRDDDSSDYARRSESPFRSFGLAAEVLKSETAARLSDEELFKSASAPEMTNAFPGEQDDVRPVFGGSVASSPAQAFLSMFSPPSASSVPVPDAVVAGYKLIQTIGGGGFSTVKKGVSSTGEVVAIKRVRKVDIERQDDPDRCRRQLDNEMDIWRTLNHEHILPLFDVERTIDADYFITLYCPAGSLYDILKRDGRPALPQDDAGMLFRQVVRGLRYLHETARVVHGDIKLENVLVDESGTCRITDFGLSRRLPDPLHPQPDEDCACLHDQTVDHAIDRLRRFTTISHTPSRDSHVGRFQRANRHRKSTPLGSGHETPRVAQHPQYNPGSLPYAAPELISLPLSQCPYHPRPLPANPAQDMWALGVLLYALLTGHLPFNDTFEPRLQMKILHGSYDPPVGVGNGAETVLRGCLEKVVAERWTIRMVDDVAWGIGWGEAGDVSTRSPSRVRSGKTSRSVSNNGKSRSRDRARPYPDQCCDSALYGSDGSVFSSSASRSRSRATRQRPVEQMGLGHTLHSPSMKTTFSSSTENSAFSSDGPSSPGNDSVPPSLLSRGRASATGVEPYRLRSTSNSHSRSRSTPESPATPSDVGSDSVAAFHDHISRGRFMPTVPEKEEEVPRGRPRAPYRRENDLDRG